MFKLIDRPTLYYPRNVLQGAERHVETFSHGCKRYYPEALEIPRYPDHGGMAYSDGPHLRNGTILSEIHQPHGILYSNLGSLARPEILRHYPLFHNMKLYCVTSLPGLTG